MHKKDTANLTSTGIALTGKSSGPTNDTKNNAHEPGGSCSETLSPSRIKSHGKSHEDQEQTRKELNDQRIAGSHETRVNMTAANCGLSVSISIGHGKSCQSPTHRLTSHI